MAKTAEEKCPGSGAKPRITPAGGGPQRGCRVCSVEMSTPGTVMPDHERVIDLTVPDALREQVDGVLLRDGFLGQ